MITGSSGFIGMHISLSLLNDGYEVCGVDEMNDYYDLTLKEARLKILLEYDNFTFYKTDISELKPIEKIFKDFKPQKVVNLAAQAGVRYSIKNPYAYIQSNIIGFTNIIELCRYFKVEGLIYASSSSVYGLNKNIPFSIEDRVDKLLKRFEEQKDILYDWHQNDPINQSEINRTWEIADYQDYPNPFILDETLVQRCYFEQDYVLGDVNQDNIINVLDIIVIMNYILNLTDLNDQQLMLSDMNQDQGINILDIVLLIGEIIS